MTSASTRHWRVSRIVVPAYLFWADPAVSLAEFGERVVAPVAGI